jgi:hypothetical protein
MLDRILDVIGIVKADKKRYLVGGRRLSLQELYFEAVPVQVKNKGILRSVRTELSPGTYHDGAPPVEEEGMVCYSEYGLLAVRRGNYPDLRHTLGH